MQVIKGNLIELALQGYFNVIVHGCNCFHTMGAGIAKQIRTNFPEAYQADCATRIGDKSKLGDFSYALVAKKDVMFHVVNAYTQFNYGRDGKQYVDYTAIDRVFRGIAIAFPGAKIGYPAIGCGLAGGDWNIVSKIIDTRLVNHEHFLVVLDL
jgi:O-acetyl-ADP-ribose deacetylase (regulator of RNase III)